MLELKDIELSYGKIDVLKKLSLEVLEHEIYALVGPENSGKSSVCQIVTGLLHPDHGDIFWYGKEVTHSKAYRKNVGYVPEKWKEYRYQSVLEYLLFFCELYGMNPMEAKKRSRSLLELVGLDSWAERYMTELSRGEQRKLLIGRALVHQPKILILDNVFAGLDPISRVELQVLLVEIKKQKTAVLFTASDIDLASKICDKVAIIDRGQIAASGTVEDILRLKQSSNPIVIHVVNDVEKAVQILRNNPRVNSLSRKENFISVWYDGEEEEQGLLLTELIMHGITVKAFYKEESDFDSLYLKITNQS